VTDAGPLPTNQGELPDDERHRRAYAAPALRSHGRLRDLVRQGNDIPAPDPMTGLTNQAT